ncbi:MAG: hypothetical protein KDD45_15985 [Bdellovibrionales bacterium]|nr:hypothetical protein [Bdellovibrionales bacterium]
MQSKLKSHLFFALKEEVSEGFLELGHPVQIMGIGKLNAAISLMNFYQNQNSCDDLIIVNLGTAGSKELAKGSLVEITEFYERDTFFRSPKIQIPAKTSLPSASCGSGDQIADLAPIGGKKTPWSCVDMEAYALVKICHEKNLQFVSIKYITDNSDENTYQDWKQNVLNAKAELFQFWKNNLDNKSF